MDRLAEAVVVAFADELDERPFFSSFLEHFVVVAKRFQQDAQRVATAAAAGAEDQAFATFQIKQSEPAGHLPRVVPAAPPILIEIAKRVASRQLMLGHKRANTGMNRLAVGAELLPTRQRIAHVSKEAGAVDDGCLVLGAARPEASFAIELGERAFEARARAQRTRRVSEN